MPEQLVPYIASWSGEEVPKPEIVEHPSGFGIAFRDEQLVDRDSRGVLWDRYAVRPGAGKPRYAVIHTARQRRAMRVLLCQVCGDHADISPDGVLWLLPAETAHWPGWPNACTVSEPPVCAACVDLAVRHCPTLKRGHLLVRARRYSVHGVSGLLYRASQPHPVITGQVTVSHADPTIRWVLATKLVRALDECEIL
jgi:hypothetical protein